MTSFLYQLLITMCSVGNSGIRKDTHNDLSSEVEKWINIYADQIGLGEAYSKKFEHISIDDMVRWYEVFIQDRTRGGSNVAMYIRWQQGADYNV